jgi:hypothetical protein
MINFNTSNLILVCYPQFSGGKFLINSLGLSNDAIFQDRNLAERQLFNSFTQQDKFDYIENQITEVKTKWTDLNLGNDSLFGFRINDYLISPQVVQNYGPFFDVVESLSNSDKKFFLGGHWPILVDKYLEVWPNSSVIVFYNYNNFINNIRKNIPWKSPKYLTFQNKLDEEYFNYGLKLGDKAILWDTSRYSDEDQTINGIRELYQKFSLDNFNEDLLRKYYNLWFNKLIEIKHK